MTLLTPKSNLHPRVIRAVVPHPHSLLQRSGDPHFEPGCHSAHSVACHSLLDCWPLDKNSPGLPSVFSPCWLKWYLPSQQLGGDSFSPHLSSPHNYLSWSEILFLWPKLLPWIKHIIFRVKIQSPTITFKVLAAETTLSLISFTPVGLTATQLLGLLSISSKYPEPSTHNPHNNPVRSKVLSLCYPRGNWGTEM